MHVCLQIAEIVFKILEKADEIPRPPPDASSWISCAHDEYQATLRRDPVLSLARVCKAFHLQAICFIWREITLKGNIEPFIKCFRDTDWIRSTTGAHLRRNWNPIPRFGWDNFLLHASKVRKLTLESDSHRFSNSGLESLIICRPQRHTTMFPALTTLVWKGVPFQEMRTRMFVSSSLHHARLAEIPSREVGKFIRLLSTSSPFLLSLDIGLGSQADIRDSNELAPFNSKFPRLQTFTTEMHLSPSALYSLRASLPQLVELSCSIRTSTKKWKPKRTAEEEISFPALRRVSFNVERVTSPFLNFITTLVSSPIHEFKLKFTQPSISADLAALFPELAKFRSLSHLQVSSSIAPWGEVQDIVDASVLTQLAPLRLTTLDMSSVPFLIHDGSMDLIGAAFPRVTNLKLGNSTIYYPPVDGHAVTYDGLLNLVSLCPDLRVLGLPIDLNGLEKDDLLGPPAQQCAGLERIEVACERAHDPTTIAAIVSAAFPNAEFAPSRVSPKDPPAAVVVSWAEVNRLKEFFVLVREQTLAIRDQPLIRAQ